MFYSLQTILKIAETTTHIVKTKTSVHNTSVQTITNERNESNILTLFVHDSTQPDAAAALCLSWS